MTYSAIAKQPVGLTAYLVDMDNPEKGLHVQLGNSGATLSKEDAGRLALYILDKFAGDLVDDHIDLGIGSLLTAQAVASQPVVLPKLR